MAVRDGVAQLALEVRLWGQALRHGPRRLQALALGVVVAVVVPGAAVLAAVSGGTAPSVSTERTAGADVVRQVPAAGTSERTALLAPQRAVGPREKGSTSGAVVSKAEKRPARTPAQPPRRAAIVPAPRPLPPAPPAPAKPVDKGDDRPHGDGKKDERPKDERNKEREVPIAAGDPADPAAGDEPEIRQQGTPSLVERTVEG
ncbi:MAG: hypothetical protein ACT4PP_03530 [Sporichthyaceae bacterium]